MRELRLREVKLLPEITQLGYHTMVGTIIKDHPVIRCLDFHSILLDTAFRHKLLLAWDGHPDVADMCPPPAGGVIPG